MHDVDVFDPKEGFIAVLTARHSVQGAALETDKALHIAFYIIMASVVKTFFTKIIVLEGERYQAPHWASNTDKH